LRNSHPKAIRAVLGDVEALGTDVGCDLRIVRGEHGTAGIPITKPDAQGIWRQREIRLGKVEGA
jgi:hypothetical protein